MAAPVAVALPVVMLLVLVGPALTFIEVRGLDLLFALSPPRAPHPALALVDAEENPALYRALRRPGDDGEDVRAVPRRAYAEATRRLSRWGARVIVFDLMFSSHCNARSSEDRDLAAAFAAAGNVVVAATTLTRPGAVSLHQPVAPFAAAVWAVGSPAAHSPNECVRSISLSVQDHDTGRTYWALSLLALARFSGVRVSDLRREGSRWLVVGARRVPLRSEERLNLFPWAGRHGLETAAATGAGGVSVVRGSARSLGEGDTWSAMLINWPGPRGTLQPCPLDRLLAMGEAEGRAAFAGKAVIVGRRAWDQHLTAVGPMPGPEIQANALDTLLGGHFVRELGAWSFLGVLAAGAWLGGLAVRGLKGGRSLLVAVVLCGAALGVARELLVLRGLWMYWLLCCLAIGGSWALATLLERGAVSTLLGRFIPVFLKGRGDDGLAPVRTMDASILFSDIRDFTGTAEQLAPEEMLRLLHQYHSSVEERIAHHGGTIVKTPGDAVLAVFWQARQRRPHADCALQAAREILADVPRLAGAWEAQGVQLRIGIGLNAGPVAIGFVGTHHLEPTVIGDPVNVAQRLESLTKSLGHPLIFSAALQERLERAVAAVPLGDVQLAGRQQPIRAYGLGGAEDGQHVAPQQVGGDQQGGD